MTRQYVLASVLAARARPWPLGVTGATSVSDPYEVEVVLMSEERNVCNGETAVAMHEGRARGWERAKR